MGTFSPLINAWWLQHASKCPVPTAQISLRCCRQQAAMLSIYFLSVVAVHIMLILYSQRYYRLSIKSNFISHQILHVFRIIPCLKPPAKKCQKTELFQKIFLEIKLILSRFRTCKIIRSTNKVAERRRKISKIGSKSENCIPPRKPLLLVSLLFWFSEYKQNIRETIKNIIAPIILTRKTITLRENLERNIGPVVGK